MGCIVLGPLSLFLLGCICLGPAAAWTSFVSGFYQFVLGAVKPLTSGVSYLNRLTAIPATQKASVPFGILACKLAAINLFPVWGTNATQLLQQVSPKVEAFFEKYAAAGVLIMVGLLIGWLVALYSFLSFFVHQ